MLDVSPLDELIMLKPPYIAEPLRTHGYPGTGTLSRRCEFAVDAFFGRHSCQEKPRRTAPIVIPQCIYTLRSCCVPVECASVRET